MKDNRLVPESADPATARAEYEQKTAALVGQIVLDVAYWDIHNFGDQPRTWDYGDWHHAVMGVELVTATGPVSVVWTDTFFPYGVEVFHGPISDHLLLGPEGPEGWAVGSHPLWRSREGSPVLAATTVWERIEVGAAVRLSDNVQVAEPRAYDVPVGLRLDFAAGPVWMVAGMPQWPDVEKVFVPGDEIMVVFSAERMRKIGFPETAFTGQ